MRKSVLALCCLSLLCLTNAGQAQTASSQYKIANRISVDGEGGWDLLAVDETSGRLYMSHSTMVQVIDTKAGKVVGTIPNTNGVHAIAIASDLKKGFITCGKDSTVAIFDLESLKILASVAVTGQNPDAILYDSFSHQVFVFNGKSSNATVIDANTNKVTSTIALDGKPELPVSDENGTVFVNLEDKSMIDVINAKTMKVEQKWPIAPGEEPTGLAIDKENNRLFAGCNNKMMVVIDSKTGKVITTLPVGEHVDGVAFDPEKKRAYSSNGDGTLTVVQEEGKDKFSVLETVTTQKGARTLAVDTKTHHIFLPTAEFGPPPAPTTEHPKPRPSIKPGTFVILDVEPLK
ncbi:MAG: YncE family protein [Candidatus Riflebacteria bacterium]|nr:YncE family protein [Candidatus Riflebacteria bacterium]